MKVGYWNVRGLRDDEKNTLIFNAITDENLGLI
jgi:hypothetical protein